MYYSKGRFAHNVAADDHDHETISLISIISDSLKPWIQAAEDRVKVFTLSENLVLIETEITVSPFLTASI